MLKFKLFVYIYVEKRKEAQQIRVERILTQLWLSCVIFWFIVFHKPFRRPVFFLLLSIKQVTYKKTNVPVLHIIGKDKNILEHFKTSWVYTTISQSTHSLEKNKHIFFFFFY